MTKLPPTRTERLAMKLAARLTDHVVEEIFDQSTPHYRDAFALSVRSGFEGRVHKLRSVVFNDDLDDAETRQARRLLQQETGIALMLVRDEFDLRGGELARCNELIHGFHPPQPILEGRGQQFLDFYA